MVMFAVIFTVQHREDRCNDYLDVGK